MMKKKKKNIMIIEIYFFQFIFFNFYKLINRILIKNDKKDYFLYSFNNNISKF